MIICNYFYQFCFTFVRKYAVKVFEQGEGKKLSILYLDTDKVTQNIKLPNFLKIAREVTGDENYSRGKLCQMQKIQQWEYQSFKAHLLGLIFQLV